MKHGKRFRQQYGKVQRDHIYPPAEAINLIKETASASFDETVELHIRLGVNVRHAEEQLRGTLALPHGLGKDVKVAVFAQGDKARDAEAAGADIVGADDLAAKIEEGYDDFDVVIATPDMMKSVGRLGKVLGPRGLMPSAKTGSVTFDIASAIKEIKAGRVEFRVDKFAIVHNAIGKKSFSDADLRKNFDALVDAVVALQPAGQPLQRFDPRQRQQLRDQSLHALQPIACALQVRLARAVVRGDTGNAEPLQRGAWGVWRRDCRLAHWLTLGRGGPPARLGASPPSHGAALAHGVVAAAGAPGLTDVEVVSLTVRLLS